MDISRANLNSVTFPSVKKDFILKSALSCFLLLATLAILAAWYHPSGHDWHLTLRPVIRDLVLNGKSPYKNPYFHNPPWILLPLVPFAILSPGIDTLAIFSTCLLVFGFVAYRLGASPLSLSIFLLTPQVLNAAGNGQVDWLVALGIIAPRWLGLFLVLSKPQIGLGIAIFWFVESWREGGMKRVLRDFLPVSISFILTFAIFGPYLLDTGHLLAVNVSWNVSFWPWSIPIGLLLLISAIRGRNQNQAILASPFFSPYVAVYSWSVPVLGIVSDTTAMVAVFISLWIINFL